MAILERSHLEIIRAVAQYGSLTSAAVKLHLTQSALSHTIRKLEGQLGLAIWYREGRTLRPTQAGEYLLTVAGRLLAQFDFAEEQLSQFAKGERGTLRIGMECYPCYRWLLKIVSPYFAQWPAVEVDVKQKFQFGGIGALFEYDIDMLVTPDPLYKQGLIFEPVFDYEQVLVVDERHPLRHKPFAQPDDLKEAVLITYPISTDRLDIYHRFLLPAGISPRRQKIIETTDIMLQMVASGRGVAALPRWLVEEQSKTFRVYPIRLGPEGMPKQLFLGYRARDAALDYLRAFIVLAKNYRPAPRSAD